MRKFIRRLCYLLIAILLLLDFLLWHLDPLGAVTYDHDLAALFPISEPDATGIRYLPGRYTLWGYTLTIGHDGLRIVPHTAFSDCTIATVGDSLTFGMGVNDAETFTNSLAQHIPAHWVNAGIPGYSAVNVERQIGAVEADGYIWLIIGNDDEDVTLYQGYRQTRRLTGLSSTVNFLLRRSYPAPNIERFRAGADAILARDNVLGFVFEGQRLTELVQTYYPQVIVLPQYTGIISRADMHPNAAGHQQIADAMLPYVIEFVEGICDKN